VVVGEQELTTLAPKPQPLISKQTETPDGRKQDARRRSEYNLLSNQF
jgi:hypothetical protein